jgi:hypothetical protein
MRKILLVEPAYRNKYPPIGLMKIATYHKLIGDRVTFIKQDIDDYVLDLCTDDIIKYYLDNGLIMQSKCNIIRKNIKDYIIKGKSEILELIMVPVKDDELIYNVLKKLNIYREAKRLKRLNEFFFWDRIYVTTLFTFYWKITIETINNCKKYVSNSNELYIGGVMGTLLTKEIEEATNIKPIDGLLDKPGMLDENDIIIDDLTPDYLILDHVEYDYPAKDSYITFMTKGCTRTCSFCSVPKIEPNYREYVPTISKIKQIQKLYGEKTNLLLMDNNVLASPKFHKIIDEIKEMGFIKGAKLQTPNKYEVLFKHLMGENDVESYKISIFKYLNCFHLFLMENRSKDIADTFYGLLIKYDLLEKLSITKENIYESYHLISPIIEKYRRKGIKTRFVDFNQGTDARYINNEIMKKMSEIPIRPLRIAFDYIGMKNEYVKAVRLAAKYNIKSLSNYLLYNFVDKPDDLWERMKINIDLSKELDVTIFSFPMKYIPLFGEEAKTRSYIGKHWNKKLIRANQIILNVTKGIVASGDEFFNRAFGNTKNEYISILHMPEQYIMYRNTYEKSGLIKVWNEQFKALNKDDLKYIMPMLNDNNLNPRIDEHPHHLQDFITHYIINNDTKIFKENNSYELVRNKYQRMIKDDVFLDLTLTYDYDNSHLEDLGKELRFNVL